MSNEANWADAEVVYLPACNRLYTTYEECDDDAFIACKQQTFRVSDVVLALIFVFLNNEIDESVEGMERHVQELTRFQRDDWVGAVDAAYKENWEAETVKRIEAQETATGLRLRITFGDFVQTHSYRGDYAITWRETGKNPG